MVLDLNARIVSSVGGQHEWKWLLLHMPSWFVYQVLEKVSQTTEIRVKEKTMCHICMYVRTVQFAAIASKIANSKRNKR